MVSQLGIIAGNTEEYAHLSAEVHTDIWPGLGPLAGIGAALSHARSDYSLILACDMPFVSRPILELLIEKGRASQACIPQSADGRLQPLCGIYHRSCFDSIERLIEKGELRPRRLVEEVNALILPFEDFKYLKYAEIFFENLNTPEDLARANSILVEDERSKAEDP